MKLILLTATLILISFIDLKAQSYEYKVITSIESIVPMGIGRSRIISSEEDKDYNNFTSERSTENNKQNKSKRSSIKIDNFEETKLLNFFSIAGINFKNVASNDAIISSKINTMTSNGWDLAFVVSGVESDAGKNDGQGIYITRYIFKRLRE
ncbi:MULTISPECIES: hypothetical protein [Flavobacteriaceae]|uniref:DUF4177 domain-containing protein n=2 Tax=Flavobacteriaceae TaxID=49546 RepID=A0A4Y8AUC5_9FLAO|nr:MULTISPECIES: hypothetical protein [Flavobacteriaceae]TEW74976.1 hypothetical protein E2488_05475 [Gramella jeungdoensis]GGK42609.1 hypothetical protein GCM10007963_08300 [Lutibacter litoralis]